MKKQFWKDAVFSVITVVAAFGLNLLIQRWFDTRSLIPMIFVLGVFLISWRTQGYFWGIAASLISVLAVNYAFTFPYYAFDLISPECVASAVFPTWALSMRRQVCWRSWAAAMCS
jgi:two-component system sensor histidine kinase KdpD